MRLSAAFAALVLLGSTPMLAGCPPSPDFPRASKDELRVTRVVLYQNGIGYFERRGRVDGDVVQLRIRPEQIADILKSLTVLDLSEGRAVSVALPVEKSRAKLLADLPEQVRQSGGLLAIASAFRGARAEVITTDGTVAGRIVGVEEIPNPDGKGGDWRLTVMVGPELRTFRMVDITSLKILDRTLEVGLTKALDVALDQASWKPVELNVHLAGKRPHDLLVSYVVEMPTWKPAYRVVLDEGGQALLQGWAVVDNVSGEDWRGVSLSLTAGTPLTFTYDLYTPRFVRRADLSPSPDEMALAPPPPPPVVSGPADEEEAGAEMDKKMARSEAPARPRPSRKAERSRRYASTPPPAAQAPAPEEPKLTAAALERNFQALVAGSKIGSLYRYDLDEKVWVADRQSALVSILNARVKAEEVLLYNVERSGAVPYRAVRLKNGTSFVLEKGPIAFYRDGTFVGEALTDRVDPGLTAFIPFSMEARVHVSIDDSYRESGVQLVKIVRGHVTAEIRTQATHSYVIDNQAPEELKLWVQRTRRPGWHLTAPKDGVIDERGVYFVPVTLAAKSKQKLQIMEETPTRRQVEIFSDMARRAIALYLSGPLSARDPKLAKALREVLEVQERLGKLEELLGRLQQEKEAYSEREQQVRENLKTLGKSTRNEDLRRKLLVTMTELETKLNDVNRKLVTTNMERSELRDRLAVLVNAVTLEPADKS